MGKNVGEIHLTTNQLRQALYYSAYYGSAWVEGFICQLIGENPKKLGLVDIPEEFLIGQEYAMKIMHPEEKDEVIDQDIPSRMKRPASTDIDSFYGIPARARKI